MNKFKRFEANTTGRDFAVGDMHGHLTKLQTALNAVAFNPAVDRLFSVGDLVDSGPESAAVDTWLSKPWFFSVQGNHEAMVYDAYHFDPDGRAGNLHVANGGAWMLGLPSVERGCYAALLADLPVAIEVDTPTGLIGIVHADCPFPVWSMLRDALNGEMPGLLNVDAVCQWSRSRITNENHEGVSGVRAVIVGHTPVRQRQSSAASTKSTPAPGWWPLHTYRPGNTAMLPDGQSETELGLGGTPLKTIITMILLLIVGHASAGEQLIDIQHDSVRGVTCWIIAGTGISCLPDNSLQTRAPTSTATDESQPARASLATSMCQNEQLPTAPLPQQRGFQL